MKFLRKLSTRKRFYLLVCLFFSVLLAGIGIFLLTKPEEIEASWWNETWTYRRSIELNNSGVTVENAQIKIFDGEDLSSLVNESKLESSLDDLRFTDFRGNLLQYYIENDDPSSVEAWILIPSLVEGDSSIFMYYGNSNANSASNSSWMADIGGEISYFEGHRVHAFLEEGESTYTNYNERSVDILVVAGGGGGGGRYGGGGGAGGLIFENNVWISTLGEESAIVGAGGNGAPGTGGIGANGENSSFLDIETTGGGGGGADFHTAGSSGGSGGGASGSEVGGLGSPGQGNDGGDGVSGDWNSGGGGGAGEPGISGNATAAGNGGEGLYLEDFFGDTYGEDGWFGGGGGGGSHGPNPEEWGDGGTGGGGDGGKEPFHTDTCTGSTGDDGENGLNNTGGGGGGGSTNSGTGGCGGDGGSGIVLVRYQSDVNTPTDIIGSISTTEEISPAPILYWRFDEGTGVVAHDSSGKDNDGTITGATWETEDLCVSGKCLNFNGTDNTVNSSEDLPIEGNNPWTLSLWAKINSSENGSGRQGWYLWQGPNSQSSNQLLSVGVNSGNIEVAHWGNDHTYSAPIDFDNWQHISIVYDGDGTQEVYLNGSPMDSRSNVGTLAITKGELYVASRADQSEFLNGYIDEIKIYPYARTGEQIKSDYIAGSSGIGSKAVMGHQAETIPTPPISSDLVSYWKFDESSGTVAHDSSGENKHGTIHNATWTKEGRVGSALSFNGSNSYVSVPNFDTLNNSGEFSASFWAYLDATQGYVFWKPISDMFLLQVRSDSRYRLRMNLDGSWRGQYYLDFPLNEWHHVFLSWDGTTTKMYLNGKEEVSSTSDQNFNAFSSSDNTLEIGRRSSDYLSGRLDEIKIYNRALTPEEVLVDYNQGRAVIKGSSPSIGNLWGGTGASEYCIPGDTSHCEPPVGEWLFNDNQGSAAKDTSGNNNNGTLVNNPTWVRGRDGGGALEFNGINQYVDTGQALIPGNEDFSFSAWVDIPSSPAQDHGALWAQDPSGMFYAYTTFGSANGHIRFNGIGATEIIVGPDIRGAGWTHLTILREGNEFRLYVNGIFDSSGTNSGTVNQGNFQIGKELSTSTRAFDGLVDDVRIYDYARTPAQIMWDYNRGGPIGHWRFNECQGNTVHDVSGNDNHGTINIGPSGTQTSVGTCTSEDPSHAWYNGREGVIGSSLSFDGSDDYVDTGQALIPGNEDFSFSAWVDIPSSPAQDHGALWAQDPSGMFYAYTTFGSANGHIRFNGIGATEIIVGPDIRGAGWTHLTILREGNEFRLYVNGIFDSSGTNSGTVNQGNFQIGKELSTSTRAFDGLVDDVRIYNYALTEEQIKLLFNHNASVRF